MKIIEALKELPLILKKVQKHNQMITQYASYVEGDELDFGTAQRQEEEIKALIQSNEDLLRNYEDLNNRLALTNAETVVEINGVKKTIRGWIVYRNILNSYQKDTYEALNDRTAQSNLRSRQYNVETGVKLKKLYKEEMKNEKLAEISDLRDAIDAKLEIVNVQTDLI